MLYECEIPLREKLVMTWGLENGLGRGGMHLVTASSHEVAGRRRMEMKEDYKIEVEYKVDGRFNQRTIA